MFLISLKIKIFLQGKGAIIVSFSKYSTKHCQTSNIAIMSAWRTESSLKGVGSTPPPRSCRPAPRSWPGTAAARRPAPGGPTSSPSTSPVVWSGGNIFGCFCNISSRLAAAAAQDWLESGGVTCDGFSRLRLRPASCQQPTLGERARTFVSNVHRTLF